MQISGSTVLLTGATGGIGHAIARELHARGAELILTGRRTEILGAWLAAELGARALAIDLSDSSEVECLGGGGRRDRHPRRECRAAGVGAPGDLYTGADRPCAGRQPTCADPAGTRAAWSDGGPRARAPAVRVFPAGQGRHARRLGVLRIEVRDTWLRVGSARGSARERCGCLHRVSRFHPGRSSLRRLWGQITTRRRHAYPGGCR